VISAAPSDVHRRSDLNQVIFIAPRMNDYFAGAGNGQPTADVRTQVYSIDDCSTQLVFRDLSVAQNPHIFGSYHNGNGSILAAICK